MESRELVSVYLPTHNRRKLLQRAIESVLRQTYGHIELIVVNDASTDDTKEYLDELASTESKIIAIHMEDPGGAPAARNRAIYSAKGHFITGLDDDDEFEPDRIETFVSEWKRFVETGEEFSCLFTNSIMTDELRPLTTVDRKDRVVYHDLFRHNFIGNQVFCLRNNLVAIAGFDEGLKAWQDLETFMRLTRRFGQARFIPKATYVCHIDRERERISLKPERLRAAFEMIVQKHAPVPAVCRQLLFLQIFSSFYRVKPSFADWMRLLAWGPRPSALSKMLRASVRELVKA